MNRGECALRPDMDVLARYTGRMLSLPLQMLLLILAGLINRHQFAVTDYLKEENRALRELRGKRRLQFSDDEQHRLAARARVLIDPLILNQMVVCHVSSEPRSWVPQGCFGPSIEVCLGAFRGQNRAQQRRTC